MAEISYGFSLNLRLVKLVPVNYCFYKKEFLNCSVWAVGTMKHLVLVVVSCCTKVDDIWLGKCLGCLVCFRGRKNVCPLDKQNCRQITILPFIHKLFEKLPIKYSF